MSACYYLLTFQDLLEQHASQKRKENIITFFFCFRALSSKTAKSVLLKKIFQPRRFRMVMDIVCRFCFHNNMIIRVKDGFGSYYILVRICVLRSLLIPNIHDVWYEYKFSCYYSWSLVWVISLKATGLSDVRLSKPCYGRRHTAGIVRR